MSRSILSRMAGYRPKSDVLIAEPCSEGWKGMSGDSRVRHCAECDRQVHNLAALTPTEIEHLLATPEDLPCIRIARYADGTLLVADERRMQPPYGAIAGAAMAGLVALSATVAGAQRMMMGRIASPIATYSGSVVDSFGKPVAGAKVILTRDLNGIPQRITTESNAKGEFSLNTTTGDWQISANSQNGGSGAAAVPLHLGPGTQKANRPITMQPITVTAGVPMIMPPTKPTAPKK